jgi:hypothetical protein
MGFRIKFFISALLLICVSHGFATEDITQFSTAVFQTGGFNEEGIHPVFITQAPAKEITLALGNVYSQPQAARNLPKTINVLIPDSMPEGEVQNYLAEVKLGFQNSGLDDISISLIKIPIVELITESEKIIQAGEAQLENEIATANFSMTSSDHQNISRFLFKLKNKISDLRLWANNMSNRYRWKNKTSQEKDKAILTIFGAARGLPGIAVYAHDAGANVINIARMVIAYAADIFFTVAPQKLASLPEKIRLPELQAKTKYTVSWGLSLGLMSLGYGASDINPASLYFQIDNASPFIKAWFDRNVELKSFLFNYSLSLGIPLSFLTLGYFAKGGEGSGALSPFDISFLLEFAGLQIIDGVMGMFSNRGARVLGQKTYFSGRQENIFYSIINVLGQAQGLAVATGNTMVYKSCLAVKSVIQGLIFFVSRILPAKAPNVFIFHAKIGERDRNSYLYTEGILDPQKVNSLDDIFAQISSETPGPSSFNRWLSEVGLLFQNGRWLSEISDIKVDDKGPTARPISPRSPVSSTNPGNPTNPKKPGRPSNRTTEKLRCSEVAV